MRDANRAVRIAGDSFAMLIAEHSLVPN